MILSYPLVRQLAHYSPLAHSYPHTICIGIVVVAECILRTYNICGGDWFSQALLYLYYPVHYILRV